MFARCCLGSECAGDKTMQEEGTTSQVDMFDDPKNTQKITGYLEKRGKLKLMNSWKRYWFVLEGHLLLYYGSKEEYDALSPCKGSITLGPTCSVKPYPSTPAKFQITTRSGCVVTLRAESISEQNKWMQAICSTVNENQTTDKSPTKLSHFRYSTERVDMLINSSEQQKRNSSPTAAESPSPRDEAHLLEKLQRIGARAYCDGIVSNHQKIVNKTPKLKKLDLEPNEKAEAAMVPPKKLQFSPKVPKIKEERTGSKEEEILLEEEDYCACILEKTDDNEIPKKTQFSQPRSISFSDARGVFNRHQESKGYEKRSSESCVQDIKKRIPEENPTGKLQQSSYFQVDANGIVLSKHNNKPSNDHIIVEENVNQSENHDQTNSKPKLEKQSSLISLIGAYCSKKTEPENPQTYQDFRENELYGNPQIDTLHSEETGRETPEFEFPPPPKEAYESILDLTNINRQDDEDSLYEEAEDFIWQNEIYVPSVGPNEDAQYSEPIFPDKPQFNARRVEVDDDLYAEIDEDFTYQRSKLKNKLSFDEDSHTEYEEINQQFQTTSDKVKEVQIVKASYAESTKDFHKNSKTEETIIENRNKSSCSEDEKQIENDLYAELNEVFNIDHSSTNNNNELQIENDIYSEPKINFCPDTKNEKEVQFENDLYAESEVTSHLSGNNSRTEKEIFNETESHKQKLHETKTMPRSPHNELKIDNDLYSSVSLENEIYTKPDMNSRSQECFYDEPNLENAKKVDDGMHVYEDPDRLRIRSDVEKLTKKKKLLKTKSEEIKKQDNFIQRLLKQATRKHEERSNKGSEFSSDNADETMALLANIQVLLEKKKKFIKEMVTNDPKSNHRRVQSDTSLQLGTQNIHGNSSLAKTMLIDLNAVYSTVQDSLDNDKEVIYSEVEMIDRSSKELKDLVEELLKRNQKSNQEMSDSASCRP